MITPLLFIQVSNMTRADFEYKYDTDISFKNRIDAKYGTTLSNIILDLVDKRHEQKMTTQTLAYLSDISISTLVKIENFNQIPTLHTLQKLANSLGVDIEFNLKAIE